VVREDIVPHVALILDLLRDNCWLWREIYQHLKNKWIYGVILDCSLSN
jgi:hypothetical protein